jgi:fatty acid desaturase
MAMTLPVHLDDAALEAFARAIDAIRTEVSADLGTRDENYIRRLVKIQRSLSIGGRVIILASLTCLPSWGLGGAGWPLFLAIIGLGTLTLATAKILENMEIGHNVMHGQWDWLHDPAVHSSTWEWDNVCPAALWRHSHNVIHHHWTNVLGMDRDLGYGPLRVSHQQRWHPGHLVQPLSNALLALLFEWGWALHDVRFSRIWRGEVAWDEARTQLSSIGRKAARQLLKDYLLWPLLAGPFFLYVAAANLAANLIRNVWAYVIIFCGHFPAGVHVFTQEQVRDEPRARWYVRQVLGSCNIRGGRLFHVLSGNLGHQIEHHLFPGMPSNRYREIAPRIATLCAQFGLPYNAGSLSRQFGTTTLKILRLALPPAQTRAQRARA